MTSGSSSSTCWFRIGVEANADGCGRGAKVGVAPKVDCAGGDEKLGSAYTKYVIVRPM